MRVPTAIVLTCALTVSPDIALARPSGAALLLLVPLALWIVVPALVFGAVAMRLSQNDEWMIFGGGAGAVVGAVSLAHAGVDTGYLYGACAIGIVVAGGILIAMVQYGNLLFIKGDKQAWFDTSTAALFLVCIVVGALLVGSQFDGILQLLGGYAGAIAGILVAMKLWPGPR